MWIDLAANRNTLKVSGRAWSRETADMPYRIRWEGHGVYRRFYGVVTRKEFRDAYAEMCGDVRYEGIRYIISDYLEARPDPDLTELDLRAQAELERLRFYDSPDTVQAMVAADPKILAYIKYYESLRVSPHCLGHFATIAEARHWIAGNPRMGWSRPPPSAASAATTLHR
jgi:hypothetical protein